MHRKKIIHKKNILKRSRMIYWEKERKKDRKKERKKERNISMKKLFLFTKVLRKKKDWGEKERKNKWRNKGKKNYRKKTTKERKKEKRKKERKKDKSL